MWSSGSSSAPLNASLPARRRAWRQHRLQNGVSTMSINETRALRLLTAAFGLALSLLLATAAFGQAGSQPPTNRTINTRPAPVGSKVKFRGVVVRRDADTFIVRDASRVDTQVLLTDDTSIKSKGGFLTSGKRHGVTW